MSVSLPIDAFVEAVLGHPVLCALSVVLACVAAYPLYTALRRPRDAPPTFRGSGWPIIGGAKAFIDFPLGAVFEAQKKVCMGAPRGAALGTDVQPAAAAAAGAAAA